MICKIQKNITHSCGYELPKINELYFLNIDDLNGISTTFDDNCEYIDGIDYDDSFYKIEGQNITYTDALVVEDTQRYRQKTLDFILLGENDACRMKDYNALSLGRFAALLKVNGQWIFAGFSNGFEADENEIGGENNFHIVMTENSVVSSLPVDEAVAEAIIHNEPQPVQKNYLTFTALQSGTFSFVPKDNSESLYYSTDNGETWNEMTGETTTIASGNKVMFKGELINNSGVGTFSSTGRYNVGGNIMSLLYGDDFEDKTSLSGQNNVFLYLFANNTNIINAENLELPATTLSDNCYLNMFSGCTNMQYGPELPATTLAGACYGGMFRGCSSLIEAPELPATAATQGCYASMFWGCSSLDEAPDLPATTLASVCYSDMFRNCTSLEYAPELPATTLAQQCYKNMFRGCTALEEAPELSASTLVSNCYEYMFYSCRSLNNITMLAEDISATNAMSNWVSGVSATGDFYKLADTDVPVDSVSGVPVGWTLHNQGEHDYSLDYLTIIPMDSRDTSIEWDQRGIGTLYYSIDSGQTWTAIAGGEHTSAVTVGTKVMFKGNLDVDEGGIGMFLGMDCIIEGNIMSLLYGDNFIGQTSLSGKPFVFNNLFMGVSYTTSVENLILPATTLSEGCYAAMFKGLGRITTAPVLPATTLANYCYDSMFKGCTSLNYIKMLATDVSASYCLNNWVDGVSATGTFVKDASQTSLPTGTSGIPSGWTVVNDL